MNVRLAFSQDPRRFFVGFEYRVDGLSANPAAGRLCLCLG